MSRVNQVQRDGKTEEIARAKVLGWEGEWHEPRTWTLDLWGGEELVHNESG